MREQLKIASENDYIRIQQFLQKAGISTAGVEEHIHQFVIMENEEGELLATVGFEKRRCGWNSPLPCRVSFFNAI